MLPLATSMSPAFPLSWSSERLAGTQTVVVAVAGELDRATSPALRDHLEWRLAGGCDRIVLDTQAVTAADGGAFELLRAVGDGAARRGCRVVLTTTGEAVQRLLRSFGSPDGVVLEPA